MKFISNMVSYLLEIVVSLIVLHSISSYIFDGDLCVWTRDISSFAFVEKTTVLFVIYQLTILITLTLYDSVRKDAILSKINILNYAQINLKYDKPFEQIERIKKNLLTNLSVDYKKKDRDDLTTIIKIYEMFINGEVSRNDYEFYIENMLIVFKHDYEFYDLSWRGSFVLRIRK